jgi:hypothetical protein
MAVVTLGPNGPDNVMPSDLLRGDVAPHTGTMTQVPTSPMPLVGPDASAAERTLYAHLQAHVEAEAGMEDLYEHLTGCGHPYVEYLARLIALDEARHHRLFQEWMEAIASMAELQPATSVPALDYRPVSPETMALVERLLRFERDDRAAVKQLRRDISDAIDTTVWGVLIESLIADTEKHIGMLKFIKKHLSNAV